MREIRIGEDKNLTRQALFEAKWTDQPMVLRVSMFPWLDLLLLALCWPEYNATMGTGVHVVRGIFRLDLAETQARNLQSEKGAYRGSVNALPTGDIVSQRNKKKGFLVTYAFLLATGGHGGPGQSTPDLIGEQQKAQFRPGETKVNEITG